MRHDMDCAQVRDTLFAFLDAESAPDEREAVREHLRRCRDCRRQADELTGLEARLRRELGAEAAPPGLWTRISARLDDVDRGEAVPSASALRRRRWLPSGIAAGAMALAVIVALVLPSVTLQTAELPVVVEPVNDFITYKLSEREPDISSADPAELDAWLAGRIDFPFPVPAHRPAGFALTGSRLCSFLNRRLTALMYQKDGAQLSLYVMAADRLELPEARWVPAAGRQLSRHSVQGHASLVWYEGGLVYALVSDLPEAELLRFVAELRAAPGEPGRSGLRAS